MYTIKLFWIERIQQIVVICFLERNKQDWNKKIKKNVTDKIKKYICFLLIIINNFDIFLKVNNTFVDDGMGCNDQNHKKKKLMMMIQTDILNIFY